MTTAEKQLERLLIARKFHALSEYWEAQKKGDEMMMSLYKERVDILIEILTDIDEGEYIGKTIIQLGEMDSFSQNQYKKEVAWLNKQKRR